jgi:HlyD family secretion protein
MRPHFFILAFTALVAACTPAKQTELHGYVEGEFVRVAAPFAGQLSWLAVQRGASVPAGSALFALEQENEKAARTEAQERLKSEQARLADLQKGKRPDEVAAADAQLAQAQAALRLSAAQLKRDEKLLADNFISRDRVDQTRAARDRDQAHVAELASQVHLSQQGARADEVIAARAEMQAAQAAVTQAQWRLDQKSLKSPVSGLVYDTLYVTGEWVPAGAPVVSLLPPANIKLRFFLPEPLLAKFKIGQDIQVNCDACPRFKARVSYVSAQAEYTPPVIYSKEARTKLVYLAEARLAPEDAVKLHPGQPVDIVLP